MDENPNYNDPVIILRLSPSCRIESLSVMQDALWNRDGVSEVKFDLKYMRVCIRSTIDPFVMVEEIRQLVHDAKVKLIYYQKDPMDDVNMNQKEGRRNHRQPDSDPKGFKGERINVKEDEYFEDDKDPKNASESPNSPNGVPNVKEDEYFEDGKDTRKGQTNHGRQPNGPNGRPNAKEDVYFEDGKDTRKGQTNYGRQPNGPNGWSNAKEDEYFEDGEDRRKGQTNHGRQPNGPNGRPNAKEDVYFEDGKDTRKGQTNYGRQPNGPNGWSNAKDDEYFEDGEDRRKGQTNHGRQPNGPNGWPNAKEDECFEDYRDSRNRQTNHRQRNSPNGWPNHVREDVYYEDDGYPRNGYNYKERYVCRNLREADEEMEAPNNFYQGQSNGAFGMPSRDRNLGSQSYRFDERNFRCHFRSQSCRFDRRNY